MRMKTIEFPLEEKIIEWCKENNFDGFYSDDGPCGCSVDNLAPCGMIELICGGECVAARKGEGGPDADGNWCEYSLCPVEKEETNANE